MQCGLHNEIAHAPAAQALKYLALLTQHPYALQSPRLTAYDVRFVALALSGPPLP